MRPTLNVQPVAKLPDGTNMVDEAKTPATVDLNTENASKMFTRGSSPLLPTTLRPKEPSVSSTGADSITLRIVEATRVLQKLDKCIRIEHLFDCYGILGSRRGTPHVIKQYEGADDGPSFAKFGNNSIMVYNCRIIPTSKDNSCSVRRVYSTFDPIDRTITEPAIPEYRGDSRIQPTSKFEKDFCVIAESRYHFSNGIISINDVIEIRSQDSDRVFLHEVFPKTRNHGTVMVACTERIFIGTGILRIVTSATSDLGQTATTQVQRDMWRCDLRQLTPVMKTAVEKSPPGESKTIVSSPDATTDRKFFIGEISPASISPIPLNEMACLQHIFTNPENMEPCSSSGLSSSTDMQTLKSAQTITSWTSHSPTPTAFTISDQESNTNSEGNCEISELPNSKLTWKLWSGKTGEVEIEAQIEVMNKEKSKSAAWVDVKSENNVLQ